ncbi:hypothetical protein FRB95_000100 [Tulasnella sp. JGI-2019a]|nr:hypothetical protein FRB95_000100 [Tulasnella sp. JGI-2019a]
MYPTANLVSLSTGSDTRNKLSALDLHHALYTCREEFGHRDVKMSLDRFYERDAIYENPVLVATTRTVLTQIHTLVNQALQIGIPNPLRLVTSRVDRTLFQFSRVWSEVVEISESESFDRSRKVYIEHIVHMLFLPGMHATDDATWRTPGPSATSNDSLVLPDASNSSLSLTHSSRHTNSKHLRTRLDLWCIHFPISPLHFQLRVTSRLSFNDAGRITLHRDLWDAKDLVLTFLPILKPFYWVGARMIGLLVAAFAWILFNRSNERRPDAAGAHVTTTDYGSRAEEEPPDGTGTGQGEEEATLNALGLTDHTSRTPPPPGSVRVRQHRSNSTSVDVP